MLTFLRQIFQDVNGDYSSKRTVGIVAFLFLLACGIVNLANGTVIAEFIFDGFIWISLGCLGISIGEHLASVFKTRIEKS